jgi:hypothetical protein
MAASASSPILAVMRNSEIDRLRTEEQKELAGMRKVGERMEAEEHVLEEELEQLDDDIVHAEDVIDVYLKQDRRPAKAGAGQRPPHARGRQPRRRPPR